MKSFIKRLSAVFTAVLVFCFSVVPVKAVSSPFTIQNFKYGFFPASNSLPSYVISAVTDILENPSINPDDLFLFAWYERSVYEFCFCSSSRMTKVDDYYRTFSPVPFYRYRFYSDSIGPITGRPLPSNGNISLKFTELKTFDFSKIYSEDVTGSRFMAYRPSSSYESCGFIEWDRISFDVSMNLLFYFGPEMATSSPVVAPDPVPQLTLHGIKLGVDKKGFVEWLKSEGKESVINSPGFSFTSKQLETLIDVYDSYGNNPLAFFSSLSKTFNITTNIKAATSLFQTIQQLYHDYLTYKNSAEIVEITPGISNAPHHRNPDKVDEAVSLVTDQADDTREISILREILRTLIDIPYAVSVRFNYLQTGLTDILLNFQNQIYMLDSLPDETALAVSNNLISPINETRDSVISLISPINETRDSVNSLLGPLNDINNSINNLDFDTGSGDSFGPLDFKLDVNITEQKQQEIDDFFQDWNFKYSNKLNEKLPVSSQLSELFSDEFFEKCGIDIDEDGEVYEYYHPDVASLSFGSGAAAPDQKLVSDFISNFDGADTSFLNDVQYSSDVPDFSISIHGEKHSIFNFNLYARYRTQIHTIMIFCIYSLYFLSLFKSLPNIIGNVSDVKNAFSDYHSGGDS